MFFLSFTETWSCQGTTHVNLMISKDGAKFVLLVNHLAVFCGRQLKYGTEEMWILFKVNVGRIIGIRCDDQSSSKELRWRSQLTQFVCLFFLV